jgi:AcrR family transcriptional regulator
MTAAPRDERRKPPRRTAERILAVALDLFNRRGEPQVSTTLIAAELKISPGNLYYHYPAKEALVNTLVSRWETALLRLLGDPGDGPTGVGGQADWRDSAGGALHDHLPPHSALGLGLEFAADSQAAALDALSPPALVDRRDAPVSGWALLPALLALAWRYRFLFRDMNDLLARNRQLETHCQAALLRQHVAVYQQVASLRDSTGRPLSSSTADALTTNLMLVLIYWLCHEYVRDPRHALEPANEAALLAHGTAQLRALLLPYLDEEGLNALTPPQPPDGHSGGSAFRP